MTQQFSKKEESNFSMNICSATLFHSGFTFGLNDSRNYAHVFIVQEEDEQNALSCADISLSAALSREESPLRLR